jgi:hypothetical protein
MIKMGKDGEIPGREEILAGNDAGYEPFCNACYELLSEDIPEFHVSIHGSQANRIAHDAVVDLFFRCKVNSQILEKIVTKDDLKKHLRTQSCYLRLRQRKEVTKEKRSKHNLSLEEADELGLLGYSSLDGSPGNGHGNSSRILLARWLEPAVLDVVWNLPERRRAAIEMATEKTRHKEIAAQFEMNEKAVGQELNRGRSDIRKALPAKYLEMLDDLLK